MTDREIEVALVDQFMQKAYRLIGKRDGKPFPFKWFLAFLQPSNLCIRAHGHTSQIPCGALLLAVWAYLTIMFFQHCMWPSRDERGHG
jgi:hypothetical protein